MIRRTAGLTAFALTAGLAIAACAGGGDADDSAAMPESTEPTVVASGLNTPMGVLVENDGTILDHRQRHWWAGFRPESGRETALR